MDDGLATLEDDPFELLPIIEAVTMTHKGRKMAIHEIELTEPVESCEPQRIQPKKTMLSEVEETSCKGSPQSQ